MGRGGEDTGEGTKKMHDTQSSRNSIVLVSFRSGDGTGGDSGGHGDILGDGVIDQGSGERNVEQFPVNAAALHQFVEDSANERIWFHRNLPPLVDVVASSEDGRTGFVVGGTTDAGSGRDVYRQFMLR